MAGVSESTKITSQHVIQDVEDQPGPSESRDDPDEQIVTQHEHQSLIRGLGQRHIQMIAIAGAIVCDSLKWRLPN